MLREFRGWRVDGQLVMSYLLKSSHKFPKSTCDLYSKVPIPNDSSTSNVNCFAQLDLKLLEHGSHSMLQIRIYTQ